VEDDDNVIERMASGMSDNTGCIAAGGSLRRGLMDRASGYVRGGISRGGSVVFFSGRLGLGRMEAGSNVVYIGSPPTLGLALGCFSLYGKNWVLELSPS